MTYLYVNANQNSSVLNSGTISTTKEMHYWNGTILLKEQDMKLALISER